MKSHADEEHHGVRHDEERLLYLHFEYHSGRCGSDAGAQGIAAHSRAKAGELHPLGTGEHSGGSVKEESLCRERQQGMLSEAAVTMLIVDDLS